MNSSRDDNSAGPVNSLRRRLLSAAVAAPLLPLPGVGLAASGGRELKFLHAHTGERLRVQYRDKGAYLPDALAEINHFMRDFRTGDVEPMSVELLDLVHRLQTLAESNGTFTVFSAYRSPQTNAQLRATSTGVAKKSYHMKGEALDISLSGVRPATLRKIAVSQQAGGVGLYESSGFVHVDVGRVRQW